jgi:hypothetical protein
LLESTLLTYASVVPSFPRRGVTSANGELIAPLCPNPHGRHLLHNIRTENNCHKTVVCPFRLER